MDGAWLDGEIDLAHLSETRPAYAAEAIHSALAGPAQKIETVDELAPQSEDETPGD
jgi:hypothetical protein